MEHTVYDVDVEIEEELPLFMRQLIDFQYIMKTEDIELKLLYLKMKYELFNTYIDTCDVKGIEYFETLLKLPHNNSLSLETRINAVKSLWIGDLPYTYKRLIQKLNFLLGKDNYTVKIDNDKYWIHVITHYADYNMKPIILRSLRGFVPANLGISNDNIFEVKPPLVKYHVGAIHCLNDTYVIGDYKEKTHRFNINYSVTPVNESYMTYVIGDYVVKDINVKLENSTYYGIGLSETKIYERN